MGLYSYPILMAADILMFNAHKVPVGRDQIQHIEMARDVAARFNHLFGDGREFFVLPEALVEEQVATLPGLDGRKMSKSYDNTIPLFEGGAKKLKAAISQIVTDSTAPGEPKDPDGNALATLFQAFSDAKDSDSFRAELRAGLSWGEAKQRLFTASMRNWRPCAALRITDRKPDDIEGAAGQRRQGRAVAAPLLEQLREAVGLRSFNRVAVAAPAASQDSVTAAKPPVFKQYREADGQFHFKLLDAEGRLLLQSPGYASPREAGQRVAALKADAANAAVLLASNWAKVSRWRTSAALARFSED